MAVVINNNTRPFIIRETRQQIPCNGKFYTVPDNIACLYKEQLLIVPPSVVLYIEKTNKLLDREKGNLERERAIFEEEKKLFEPLFNKLQSQLQKAKDEKTWRIKIKRKKNYPKIDFLYSFHFNGDEQIKALERLKASIKSIKDQNVRICVCCTSKDNIYKHIKKLAKITYYHKPLDLDVYCKPKTINLGVKEMIKTPYFMLSDIDLIYPKTFISELIKYTEYHIPVRVIFNNYNLGLDYTANTYVKYKKFFNTHEDHTRTKFGIAPGNGLIHLKSFKLINGYDENYVGYGLEDADFNMRTSYICKYIELDDEFINTCHLYHKGIFRESSEVIDRYKENQKYFQNKRKILLEKIGLDQVNIFNKKEHLKYIMANV